MTQIKSRTGEIINTSYTWERLKYTFSKLPIDLSNIPDLFYQDVIDKKARIVFKARKTSLLERLLTHCKEYEETFTFEYIIPQALDE